MSFGTLIGNGTISANEGFSILRPKYYNSVKRGILFLHGHDDTNISWQNSASRYLFLRKFADAGNVVLSADLGGVNTQGNDTAVARITSAYTYLLTLGVLPTTIAMIGHSMGGLNAFVWAAQNLSKVQCIIGIVPAINLNDIWTNNRGSLTADINTAYGGTYDPNTLGAVHNPYTIMQNNGYVGLKAQVYYGDTDIICLSTYATQLAVAYPNDIIATKMICGHTDTAFDLVNVTAALTLINS